jgi:hypothetical protein
LEIIQVWNFDGILVRKRREFLKQIAEIVLVRFESSFELGIALDCELNAILNINGNEIMVTYAEKGGNEGLVLLGESRKASIVC